MGNVANGDDLDGFHIGHTAEPGGTNLVEDNLAWGNQASGLRYDPDPGNDAYRGNMLRNNNAGPLSPSDPTATDEGGNIF